MLQLLFSAHFRLCVCNDAISSKCRFNRRRTGSRFGLFCLGERAGCCGCRCPEAAQVPAGRMDRREDVEIEGQEELVAGEKGEKKNSFSEWSSVSVPGKGGEEAIVGKRECGRAERSER